MTYNWDDEVITASFFVVVGILMLSDKTLHWFKYNKKTLRIEKSL
jgi:hypothetical protein